MKIKKIVCFALIMLFETAHSTEVDSFTNRYVPMRDATARVNQITNDLIRNAMIAANKSSPGQCNELQMYKVLHNALAGMGAGTWAALEEAVEADPAIEKRKPHVRHSIYKNINGLLAPAIAVAKLGATMNLKGHIIGTDKIGHFVDQGYEYFVIAYLKNKGEYAAVRNGEFTESTIYGLMTTGIYAYADLAANYQGMQFWSHLTGHYQATDKPLLSCINNNWVQNYDFRWEDYIDESLDEGINCTGQSNQVWHRIEPILLELERKDPDHRYQCPVDRSVCPGLMDKYGNFADHIISPKCR